MKSEKLWTPKHHSVADWDILPAGYHTLSTITYVSPPTSIRFYATGSTICRISVLCRVAKTQCIPEGELRTWLRWNYYAEYIAMWKNQAPLGSADMNNCYNILNSASLLRVGKVVNGKSSVFAEIPTTSTADTWEHWRVKYWNGLDPDPIGAMCVEVYKEVGGVWVLQGQRVYDPANMWKDSLVNRSGFHVITALGKNEYYDDTEIWGVET